MRQSNLRLAFPLILGVYTFAYYMTRGNVRGFALTELGLTHESVDRAFAAGTTARMGGAVAACVLGGVAGPTVAGLSGLALASCGALVLAFAGGDTGVGVGMVLLVGAGGLVRPAIYAAMGRERGSGPEVGPLVNILAAGGFMNLGGFLSPVAGALAGVRGGARAGAFAAAVLTLGCAAAWWRVVADEDGSAEHPGTPSMRALAAIAVFGGIVTWVSSVGTGVQTSDFAPQLAQTVPEYAGNERQDLVKT